MVTISDTTTARLTFEPNTLTDTTATVLVSGATSPASGTFFHLPVPAAMCFDVVAMHMSLATIAHVEVTCEAVDAAQEGGDLSFLQ
jgi:hypothetical protein